MLVHGNMKYIIRQQNLNFELLFISYLQNSTRFIVVSAAIYIVKLFSMPPFFMQQ